MGAIRGINAGRTGCEADCPLVCLHPSLSVARTSRSAVAPPPASGATLQPHLGGDRTGRLTPRDATPYVKSTGYECSIQVTSPRSPRKPNGYTGIEFGFAFGVVGLSPPMRGNLLYRYRQRRCGWTAIPHQLNLRRSSSSSISQLRARSRKALALAGRLSARRSMANGRIGSQSLSIAIYMEGGGQGRDSKAALHRSNQSARNFSTSSAAMQPEPAEVTA